LILKNLSIFLVLSIYVLVIIVAYSEGPLISVQSFILGLIGILVITFIASSVAKSINLVDEADGHRKNHKGAIPLTGGLILFISIIYGAFVFGVNTFYIYIIASLLPIMIIGTLDGLKAIEVPWTLRLVGQILASWIVILTTDIYVSDLGNLFGQGIVNLGGFGIPFTILGVVGVCNAFNMLDGKDGLAASVAIVIVSSIFMLLFFQGITFMMGLVIISSLIIFLAFNLGFFGAERKIFLGDHGSNAIGHMIAWILIFLSQEEKIITAISTIWFAFLPITDALMTIARRLIALRSPFLADNKHFHHILSNIGLSDKKVLFIFILISIIAASIAYLSNIWELKEYNLFYGYITLLVILLLITNQRKIV